MSSTSNDKVTKSIPDSGLMIHPVHHFLAASADRLVELDGQKGLVEIKNVNTNKAIDLHEASTNKDKGNFCLKLVDGKLKLKETHAFFYQIQGQLEIYDRDWCDLVVRCQDPYELHVERIVRDKDLWDSVMFPRLQCFYFEALLPELASPRHNKYPGIRDMAGIVWPPAKSGPTTRSTKSAGTSSLPPSPLPSTSNVEPIDTTETPLNLPRRSDPVSFVGKRIKHEWKVEGGKKWFTGTVLNKLNKLPEKHPRAKFEIQYDSDKSTVTLYNIFKDYLNGCLLFID